MKAYHEYALRAGMMGTVERLLRNARALPTYQGCDPYNAMFGFSVEVSK